MLVTIQLWPALTWAVPRISPDPQLNPFIKWPGGKSMELPAIAAAAPALTGRFIDPFVGGGSVLLATPTDIAAQVNDASRDLIGLYVAAATRVPAFRAAIDALAASWDRLADLDSLYADLGDVFLRGSSSDIESVVARHRARLWSAVDPAGIELANQFVGRTSEDLRAKFTRMRKVEIKVGQGLSGSDRLANIEGSVRSALYMSVRSRYNAARLRDEWEASRLADFFFLREFSYAAMFRFNARNEFNVPYGGVSYNRKSLADKVDSMFSARMTERLANSTFHCQDFEPFLEAVGPGAEDFVFVDPPYDSDFSAYDNKAFDGRDQRRLHDVLCRLPARVMVVIKETPAIRGLYGHDHWHVHEAPKTYMWTIKSRNDREATHLTITNYLPVDG